MTLLDKKSRFQIERDRKKEDYVCQHGFPHLMKTVYESLPIFVFVFVFIFTMNAFSVFFGIQWIVHPKQSLCEHFICNEVVGILVFWFRPLPQQYEACLKIIYQSGFMSAFMSKLTDSQTK